MTRYDGTFVPITRPGAHTPDLDGPGALEIGDGVVLDGGKERKWLSYGAGCGCGGVLGVLGITLPFVLDAVGWDIMSARKGPMLVAMICIALAMGGWTAGTWVIGKVLGPSKRRIAVGPADIQAVEVQGQHVVLAWNDRGRLHLAFFIPRGASHEAVARELAAQQQS